MNRHNSTLEIQLIQTGVTVWGGISSSSVLGAFFYGTVTGNKYLEILMNQVFP